MFYKTYSMNNISISSSYSPKHIDGLICLISEEDRTLSLIDIMMSKGAEIESALLLYGEDSPIVNICEIRKNYNIFIEDFKYDGNFSLSEIKMLQKINNYVADKETIGLDISCMQIPLFAQIINFLYKKHNQKKIIVYYSEPQYYKLQNLFDYSSYFGEITLKTIPGYEGITSIKQNNSRVIFYIMGFEMAFLAKIVAQEANPFEIIPINGFPSYLPKYKDISLLNNDYDFYQNDIEINFAEANNPFETFNRLNCLERLNNEHCIDILPVGSKPMALGACLFSLHTNERPCRMLFPFPAKFKKRQSTGCTNIWEYVL